MAQSIKRSKSWKTRLLNLIGLTDEVTIKVYHGYGHEESISLFGHVLRIGPLPRTRYNQTFLGNTASLLRLFMVKPIGNVTVQTEWNGQVITAKTDDNGFFKLEWKDEPPLEQGWHQMCVKLIDYSVKAEGKGAIYIPYNTQYGFISDIDDTFLISHSSNLRKRLFVLFTQNAWTRQPFDGSVKHYQLLAKGNTTPDAPNPFFFVSSSEWNLYDFLLEFSTRNGMPRGIFLLNIMKQFSQLLKTGQNNHQTKFTRIVRILKTYPHQRFVLLGDSSQHDPYIYEEIVKHFSKQIKAVYIRDVYRKNQQKARDVLNKIESAGVHCCFFSHSREAIAHSQKIGLIQEIELIEAHEEP
ncbi:MAG TPA: phosphatase domain-containing protein, partial [Flavisolibacter sp.]|nr:phosphatase domain-containing protein [Flavisolibacter sp.]